jgi:hypothetical protein
MAHEDRQDPVSGRSALAGAVCAAVALLGALALAACGGGGGASTKPSPAWTPEAALSVPYSSFKWASSTRLRGPLTPKSWTYTASFTLKGGPVNVVGVMTTRGSQNAHFVVRVMPQDHGPGFTGYPCVPSGQVIYGPMLRADQSEVIDWCPFDLPAGNYRVMLKQTGGSKQGGTYDLGISQVK